MSSRSILTIAAIIIAFYAIPTTQIDFKKGVFGTALNVATAQANVGEKLITNLPVLVPSFAEIGQFGKQSLLGYPFEGVAFGIHQFCSAAVATNGTQPKEEPDLSLMNYVLLTAKGNFSFPLNKANDLWSNPHFSKDLKTVLLVTGWLSAVEEPNQALDVIYNAYRTRGEVNFVLIDTAAHLDTLYSWSAFNTNSVGEALGDGLLELVNYVPLESIHLIGHSLGAHVSGAAGRRFQEKKGVSLPRITGLDPANPCFNEGETLSGLSRGDADLVDVIHSNVRVLGKRDPLGDIDFYPNGLHSVQPGCITVVCSHARAWEYYAESVLPGNESNFVAVKCNGISALNAGLCRKQTAIMGYNVSRNMKGNFFLRVNSKSPYGRKIDF